MEKVILNESLQKVLDALGNTPIEEPKVFKLLGKSPLVKSDVIKFVFKDTDLKMKSFKAMEIAELFNAIHKKITNLKLDDGSYKSTELTRECNLPDFEECEDLQVLWMKLAEIGENPKKQAKLMTEMVAKAFDIAGIDKSTLSTWEQDLVTQQVIHVGTQVAMTSLGKDLKNS